jgi:AraC-like DNA-binding protein
LEDLQEIIDYVEKHIQNKLNLKELSDFMGYSSFYISRKFMNIYGIPLTAFVRIRKFQYSIKDLINGMKVIDVAMKYSFESHEGFTRSFENILGFSPSNVRKYFSSDYSVPKVNLLVNNKQNSEEDSKMNLFDDMHKIIFVFLKKSFEEMKAKFSNEIQIELYENNFVKISDNGRGIRLEENGIIKEEILKNIFEGKPITKSEYLVFGDIPLDDLKLINSLCENLTLKVYRNNTCYTQDFVRGIPQHKILSSPCNKNNTGTEITLKPDTSIFGEMCFQKDKIENLVKILISENQLEAKITCSEQNKSTKFLISV